MFPVIAGSPPEQFELRGSLQLTWHPSTDSAAVVLRIPTVDSSAQVRWVPTRVRFETDAGVDTLIEVAPSYCLDPAGAGGEFPLSFDWFSCRVVVIETSQGLSRESLRALEQRVRGEVQQQTVLPGLGAEYLVSVPVGNSVADSVAARLEDFPFVRAAGPLSTAPPCIADDVLPRPACPAWEFLHVVPIAFTGVSSRGLRMTDDGWIRAIYSTSTGRADTAFLSMPRP